MSNEITQPPSSAMSTSKADATIVDPEDLYYPVYTGKPLEGMDSLFISKSPSTTPITTFAYFKLVEGTLKTGYYATPSLDVPERGFFQGHQRCLDVCMAHPPGPNQDLSEWRAMVLADLQANHLSNWKPT
jgi:hypothetical protein